MPWGYAAVAAATVAAAYITSESADDAAHAQTQASGNAIGEQRRQFDLTRSDFAPYRETGTAALAELRARMGLSPGGSGELARKFTLADFEADPVNKVGFKFGLDEGTKALNRTFAARGMTDSGAAAKALTRYATDYAGTKAGESYNRFLLDNTTLYNRLAGISGTGQTAAATSAQAGATAASNIGGYQIGAGNAQAAASMARASGYTGALQSGVNTGMSLYTMDRVLGSRQPASNSTPYFYYDGGTADNPAYG